MANDKKLLNYHRRLHLAHVLDCFMYCRDNLNLHAFELFSDSALEKVLADYHELRKPLDSSPLFYLHVNVLKPSEMQIKDFTAECEKVSEILFAKVADLKGSISAEHGVGLLKKPHLHFSRSEREIELMRSIKKVFDPKNIINPGKIF